MADTKYHKRKYSPLKSTKIGQTKRVENKSRFWPVILGILCIIAAIILFLSLSKDGKMKDGGVTKVPYDIKVVKNEQKSVDEGHSPWKLDPVFVTQVFVSLQISPEGIVGEYPISTKELKLIQMTKSEAIVQVTSKKTSTSIVYLKRLVRQDSTGIWTVVAYETMDNNMGNIPPGKENTPAPSKENKPEPNKENMEPGKENITKPNQESNPEPNKENIAEPNKENVPETKIVEPSKENTSGVKKGN